LDAPRVLLNGKRSPIDKTGSPMPSPDTLRKLCRVRDFIRYCHGEPLSLDQLSAEADLSTFHFLRTFRQAFGETPHAFQTRLRVERAKDLLTVSSRPVTEICFDVGFTSLGSFSTLFRRQVGQSPAEFRRRVRAWVSVPGKHPWAFVPFCFGQHYGPLGPPPVGDNPSATPPPEVFASKSTRSLG
jgi:transcriptional regulator GlxA family with amidase domain